MVQRHYVENSRNNQQVVYNLYSIVVIVLFIVKLLLCLNNEFIFIVGIGQLWVPLMKYVRQKEFI